MVTDAKAARPKYIRKAGILSIRGGVKSEISCHAKFLIERLFSESRKRIYQKKDNLHIAIKNQQKVFLNLVKHFKKLVWKKLAFDTSSSVFVNMLHECFNIFFKYLKKISLFISSFYVI